VHLTAILRRQLTGSADSHAVKLIPQGRHLFAKHYLMQRLGGFHKLPTWWRKWGRTSSCDQLNRGLRSKKQVVTPLQTEFNNWSNAEQPHEAWVQLKVALSLFCFWGPLHF